VQSFIKLSKFKNTSASLFLRHSQVCSKMHHTIQQFLTAKICCILLELNREAKMNPLIFTKASCEFKKSSDITTS